MTAENKGLKGEGHHFKCKNVSEKGTLDDELILSYQGYYSGNGQLLVVSNLVITNYLLSQDENFSLEFSYKREQRYFL